MADDFKGASEIISKLSQSISGIGDYSDQEVMKDSRWIWDDMNLLGPLDPKPNKREAMTEARCRDAVLQKPTKETEITDKEIRKVEDEMVAKFIRDLDNKLFNVGG
jgi:hypothetical protein